MSRPEGYKYTFTVVTPTFNRAAVLGEPYNSLLSQTFRDFEWIVVDDGSKDNTHDLVARWQQRNEFPIRYIFQENAGKHTAFNIGVREARGRFVVPLDSDDRCVPQALERFLLHWNRIPISEQDRFAGVSCLCMDVDGRVVGEPFPQDVMDVAPPLSGMVGRFKGEKWGFMRTDILRAHPFPEIPGEKYVPEGLVWNRIGRRYFFRYVNEMLRIYVDTPDSLTTSATRIRVQSPVGTRLYYRECLGLPAPWQHMLRNLLNYIRFSFHAGIPLRRVILESDHAPLVTFSAPIGYLYYRRDLRRWGVPGTKLD